MKKTFSRIFYVLFISFGGLAQAQESRNLSLTEAISLGIENSKTLKIDAAKVETATANFLAAKNNRLPDLKVSASALALANAKVDLKILPPTAGSSMAAPNSAYFGSANFSLPLYAGGRIKYGMKSAEYLVEAQKLAIEQDKTAIAYNIAQAYNNLYKADQSIIVLKENLKATQERDKTFLNLEKNGVIPRNDRLKASLQTSTVELQLLEAENNFAIATINMNLLLGLPDSTVLSVDPTYAEPSLVTQDLSYYLAEAFKNRKDLQMVDFQKKAAELGKKSAKAEELPSVALTAGYIASDVPNILTAYNVANVGIGVQYNLANLWKKNTSEMSAESQSKQLDASSGLISDQIKLEVNKDFQNYLLANRKIDVLEKAVSQANENFRITKNKYNNGLETMTNLLEADAAQITANIDVLNAKADAALAYRKLLQSTGIIISK